MDSTKIESVTQGEQPKNVIKIRSFLGLTGYFQRFIKGFSTLATPLTHLTRKDVAFEDDNYKKSFL